MALGDELLPHVEEMTIALQDLYGTLIEVLNGRAEIGTLSASMEKWEKIRQKVNNEANMGLTLGFALSIVAFPLTGDIHRDAGQINFKKLEEQ